MRVTRNIVAKEAGVTPTTVSCVLNNTRPVSDAVRQRVMDTIKRLDYVSDFSARSICGKKTKQIVIIVNDLLNPFFASMVSELEHEVNDKGYFLSISSEKDLDKNISTLLARRVDAAYFCAEIQSGDWEKLSKLVNNGIKVLISPKIDFLGEKSTIDTDVINAVKEGVKYLTEKGHKEIVYITNYENGYLLDDREKTYISEMNKRLLIPKIVNASEKNLLPSIELGRKLFDKAIETYPELTAIFGLNDMLAIGAMMQAKDRGYKVPEDVSFLGMDGIYLSNVVSPKLTTYACNMKEFAKRVFELIVNSIENDKYGKFVQSLEFIEGDSVKDLNDK